MVPLCLYLDHFLDHFNVGASANPLYFQSYLASHLVCPLVCNMNGPKEGSASIQWSRSNVSCPLLAWSNSSSPRQGCNWISRCHQSILRWQGRWRSPWGKPLPWHGDSWGTEGRRQNHAHQKRHTWPKEKVRKFFHSNSFTKIFLQNDNIEECSWVVF